MLFPLFWPVWGYFRVVLEAIFLPDHRMIVTFYMAVLSGLYLEMMSACCFYYCFIIVSMIGVFIIVLLLV